MKSGTVFPSRVSVYAGLICVSRCNIHVKSDLADSEDSFEVLMAAQIAALGAQIC